MKHVSPILATVFAEFAITVCGAGAAVGVQVIQGTAVHRITTAGVDNGSTSVMAKNEELDFDVGGDEHRYARLLVLYSAATKRYWWVLSNEGARRGAESTTGALGSNSAAFITPESFVMLSAGLEVLVIQECSGQADDLDTAETKALSEVNEHLHDAAIGRPWGAVHRVDLSIPSEFYTPPGASMYIAPRIIAVAHEHDEWRVTIECRWKEEVTLDSKFQVVAVAKID